MFGTIISSIEYPRVMLAYYHIASSFSYRFQTRDLFLLDFVMNIVYNVHLKEALRC